MKEVILYLANNLLGLKIINKFSYVIDDVRPYHTALIVKSNSFLQMKQFIRVKTIYIYTFSVKHRKHRSIQISLAKRN